MIKRLSVLFHISEVIKNSFVKTTYEMMTTEPIRFIRTIFSNITGKQTSILFYS